MNLPQEAPNQIREDLQFNQSGLHAWLSENIADYAGPLAVERCLGGQSNPTYKLITPRRNYILRRKPPGQLLKGAHAIEREAKVLIALERVGFPVAKVFALCTDDNIIGTWFYVMEFVEGRIFWDCTFPTVTRESRPTYFEAMNNTIANLHMVDYQSAGLSDYARTGGYFKRQLDRWSNQYFTDEKAGRNAHMDKLIDWLRDRIPDEEETTLVHGDFRCDNMIFHPSEPRILAVLDWELSTLGHPLADFAYHTMMFRMPPHIVAGLAGADLPALNITSEAQYVAEYCRCTQRESIPDYQFHMVFNFFRIAAIFHGIKGRVIRRTASSDQALERVKVFPELAELAWLQTDRTNFPNK